MPPKSKKASPKACARKASPKRMSPAAKKSSEARKRRASALKGAITRCQNKCEKDSAARARVVRARRSLSASAKAAKRARLAESTGDWKLHVAQFRLDNPHVKDVFHQASLTYRK